MEEVKFNKKVYVPGEVLKAYAPNVVTTLASRLIFESNNVLNKRFKAFKAIGATYSAMDKELKQCRRRVTPNNVLRRNHEPMRRKGV